jgi:hypothetical protein|nr:hypothetical protein Q903MT_gene283 [Picea sitchensis]
MPLPDLREWLNLAPLPECLYLAPLPGSTYLPSLTCMAALGMVQPP